jgi:hypothetical protein
MKISLLLGLALAVFLGTAPSIFGDEGMWLFNNPPRKHLEEKYKFEPTDKWLEHVQKASVRFNSGGSGSFVSADGLVMTNHHVGADALQKMGDDKHNYLRDGFYARTRGEERKCEAIELNVLQSIEDVTERINAAVKPDMSPAKSAVARRAAMAEIEKESQDKTGLRSDVVTLYQGGVYNLYRYKKYTDVRIVFAPEQQIAFYGGDPDNFEYPRFDLDICFFRVYENDKPAKIEHYLKWSKNGAADDELVFVSGHPGTTNRQNTIAELEFIRDRDYPFQLKRFNRLEVLLGTFGARSEENSRQARELFLTVQNSRKARVGGLAALLDPSLMHQKEQIEKKLQAFVNGDHRFESARSAWERIAAASKAYGKIYRRYNLIEGPARGGARGFNSDLFRIARTIVRATEEQPKANVERLREFRDSNKESLELQLFSEEPIYNGLETLLLADSLTLLATELGAGDPFVQKALAGKSPNERAYQLVSGTHLKDVGDRKKLYSGGLSAVEASDDPMIQLAKLIDPTARELRKTYESEVDEVKRTAHAEIAKAKFALEGTNTYPDATFTLRLSFGPVKGYEEDGKKVPYQTTFAGLYERSAANNNQSPFDLPPRWVERKSKLDLNTPFNFVCTADIIGGNSGSPVINRNAELVGIIFDGNIQSLALDFAYDDIISRAVSVHSAGIVEALRKVYDATGLVDELVSGNAK